MLVPLFGLLLFCVAFILHAVLWKIHLPKRQTKTLLQVFFGFLFFGILFLISIPSFAPEVDNLVPKGILEYLHICLIFVSLTLAYMITYSALEADSPTLVMVMTIAKAGSVGLDKEEFDKILNDDLLIKPRINDLVLDKMAYMERDRYKLTPKGMMMARLFIIYRRILNAGKGG